MKQVLGWWNESTLGLLFGMMVLVHFLSETGVFQWAAVRMYGLSKGNNTVLLVLLNVATAVFSAFLDNTTTALLMGPVAVQVCEIQIYSLSCTIVGPSHYAGGVLQSIQTYS